MPTSLGPRLGVPPKLVAAVLPGTILNPLNSSMIAVALVSLQDHFDVGVATSTWLISGFYLSAAIGQPLMGRLVDLFGARRLFFAGVLLVLAVSVLAPFAPGFWWLVVLRAVQGLGSSAAYPAALVLFRGAAAEGRPPTGALAVLGVTAGSSAALGPVIGGALIATAGWQAIFLVNVPLTVLGMVNALLFFPRTADRGPAEADRRLSLRSFDVPGVLLFGVCVATLLTFLLSLATTPQWWLGLVAAAASVVLVLWERSVPAPFLDVRGLVANRALASILVQQAGVNVVFYAMFFGLPIWMEAVRGIAPERIGPLMLPFTIVTLLITPLTARAIKRHGVKPALLGGSILMVGGTALVQLLGDQSPVLLLLAICVVMGLPNGLNNLALQTGIYAASPPERTGASGGLFQTCRYLGAILASSVLGVLLEKNLSSGGLHEVGLFATGFAIVLVALAILLPRGLGR